MRKRNVASARRLCLAAVLLGTLAGCSSVPDAVNPVSWYRGVRDWVSGDDPQQAQAKADAAKPVPGSDKAFPSLGTVPERRPEPSTAAERKQAARSLAADREQAQYTDLQIRRQTDDATNRPRPPAPTPAQVASTMPAAAPPPSAPMAVGAPPPLAPMPAPALTAPPLAQVAQAPVRPNASSRLPSRNVQRIPPNQMPEFPAAPPPPPVVAAPTMAPPPAAVRAQPAPLSRSASTARAPAGRNQPLEFGPPPADIAIMQAGATMPMAPVSPRTSRAPVTAMPDSPYSPRFPSGVPFAPSGSFAQPNGFSQAGGFGGQETRVATIHFASGSSRIGKGDAAAIRRAVQAFKQQGGVVKVVGHASSRTLNLDPMRHEMANFAISLDRANAVARELIRLGVSPNAVRVVAMSDSQPVFHEVMPAGEAGNRRAEILIEH